MSRELTTIVINVPEGTPPEALRGAVKEALEKEVRRYLSPETSTPSPPEDMSLEESIRTSRASRYGKDHVPGHANVGKIWAALLSGWLGQNVPDIPPDIVCLMLAGNKMHRAALEKGRGWQDSYVDARIYLDLSEEAAAVVVGLRTTDQIQE